MRASLPWAQRHPSAYTPTQTQLSLTRRGSAEEVPSVMQTRTLEVVVSIEGCSFPLAALFDVGDTIWRRGERKQGGRHIHSSSLTRPSLYLDLSEVRVLFSVATLRQDFSDSPRRVISFKKCQFFSLNNHPVHPRWLPGTPPPPMPCWTGVPPSSPVIGPVSSSCTSIRWNSCQSK